MSMWELLVILLVALVVFSPEQLPTIARSAGRLWRKMHKRAFVLFPLYEINPDLIMPDGTTIETLWNHCDPDGIVQLPVGATSVATDKARG